MSTVTENYKESVKFLGKRDALVTNETQLSNSYGYDHNLEDATNFTLTSIIFFHNYSLNFLL